MQRWQGLKDVPTGWGRSVVTIGVFDGVHRGHQSIIADAVGRAAELGVPSVLITFVPHPAEVVRPGAHPPVLTSLVRRAELVEELGVDVFCALPFTLELSKLSPAEFVHATLVDRLHVTTVIVGENFRFGHKAEGDVGTLQELGRRFGFSARGDHLLTEHDTTLSATYVRSCVQAGDVRTAAEVLGRPHRLDGVVERGDRRGRELGYPTANLRTDDWAAVPADGVYAGRVVLLDEWGRTAGAPPLGTAAISVGTNPTFDVRQRRVEAFVLDFDADLYGANIGVEFVARLRGMERYDGVDALVAQMALDVEQTRTLMQ
ncbi:bifunctional riboflavin kinase/FAD synthetase [uncultured Jatrophihabitans sp.]|uniref:bifunctional riboflavin kinase/FAD synthetase n=1 Tax=uncultured Jatrophihabitans sp. TaxID=1610747 RepID=UPI0035C9440E